MTNDWRYKAERPLCRAARQTLTRWLQPKPKDIGGWWMTHASDTETRRGKVPESTAEHVCCLCLNVSPSCAPSLSVLHTVFTFAYTQNQIRGPNCYHMVTIVRPENGGGGGGSSNHREIGGKAKPNWDGRRKHNSHMEEVPLNFYLYIRSMSISGSSWNSLIFTVSDKMQLRFLKSSSTYQKTQNVKKAGF